MGSRYMGSKDLQNRHIKESPECTKVGSYHQYIERTSRSNQLDKLDFQSLTLEIF
jgi:hypothetical protein